MVARTLDAVEVRRDVHDAFNAEIQAAMVGTVWMANCNNYFRHPNGKVVTQFPYSGLTFAQRLAQVRMDVFDVLQGRVGIP
jgi:cyclohexanone monooxygenase